MTSPRYWAVVVLLASTALLLHFRGDTDATPPREPLSQVPQTISGWDGSDVGIDPEQLEILGAGDFLSRIYRLGQGQEPIGLFIGYFPTQRTGTSIHSPKHCLPGAGWTFESSKYIELKDPEGKPHRVGEYILAKGETKQFAIYWYQAHGRSVANEYVQEAYMIADAMRYSRTDGALVRVLTPIGSAETTSEAQVRAEGFARRLLPVLPRFIPD